MISRRYLFEKYSPVIFCATRVAREGISEGPGGGGAGWGRKKEKILLPVVMEKPQIVTRVFVRESIRPVLFVSVLDETEGDVRIDKASVERRVDYMSQTFEL